MQDELNKRSDDIDRRNIRFVRREQNFRHSIEELQDQLRIRLNDEDHHKKDSYEDPIENSR